MGRVSIVPELEKKLNSPLKPWMLARIAEGKSPEEIAGMLEIGKSKAYELISDFGLKEEIKKLRVQKKTSVGSLAYYFDKYIKEKEDAQYSGKTTAKDKSAFRSYLWWLGHFNKPLDLDVIKNSDIMKEYFHYLSTETNRFGRQFKNPVSPGGQISYAKQFKAFIHWGQLQGIIPDEKKANPFTKMLPIKMPKGKPEDIPDIVIDKVLASFDDSFKGVRDKTIFAWFLETGQRIGGVAEIRLRDFDWEKGMGTVTEKGKKERTIVLSKLLQAQVKDYMEMREKIAKCDYLWVRKSGEHFEAPDIYDMFHDLDGQFREDMEKYATKPGQTIHPHAMRHVWAKHLAQAEVPLFALMVMAGWESLSLVERYARAYTQETAWKYIDKASPLSQKK